MRYLTEVRGQLNQLIEIDCDPAVIVLVVPNRIIVLSNRVITLEFWLYWQWTWVCFSELNSRLNLGWRAVTLQFTREWRDIMAIIRTTQISSDSARRVLRALRTLPTIAPSPSCWTWASVPRWSWRSRSWVQLSAVPCRSRVLQCDRCDPSLRWERLGWTRSISLVMDGTRS